MTGNVTYQAALDSAKSGDFSQAENICWQLLDKDSEDYLSRYLLASVMFLTYRYEESRSECKKLLQKKHTNPDVFNLMAAISTDYDVDLDAATSWLEKALACTPQHIKALTNLAGLHFRKQEKKKAKALYLKAMRLSGNQDAGAMVGLGMLASGDGNLEEAARYFHRTLKKDPNNRQALASLITCLYSMDNFEGALESSLKVLEYDYPGLAVIPAFACTKSFCLWEAAEKLLPELLRVLDDKVRDRNLLMQPNLSLFSSYEVTNQQLLQAHIGIGKSIALARLHSAFTDYPKAFAPTERVRLAYLSPDLRSHVVSHFFRGLVNHRDRQRFEVFLYSNLDEAMEDEVTESYKKHADHYINVWSMTDTELARRIRNDGIHILIEMSGYTANNRVAALAYKPAPIQISYLGYPFSLGMPEIDYHISDPWLDGPENAKYSVEKPLRMPQSFLAFGELNEQRIDATPAFERNGHITFGSLNNVYKLNRGTLKLWSRILHATPSSKLYLNHGNYKYTVTQKCILDEFVKWGIDSSRIIFVSERHPTGNHLRYYNEFDIMLDSMPLTGGTTTVEALWMGVPVITKVGDAHPQRMSYSIIKNTSLALDDCIAFSEEEYVERAVTLAGKPRRIKELRSFIPQAMRGGILQDPRNFTAQMEAVLVDAWNSKYPECPLEGLLTGQVFKKFTLQSTTVVLADTLKDLHAYVLLEQGKWYEPESEFLERQAAHFNNFHDYAVDPGMFAVPVAAAQRATGGVTFAMRDPGMFSILLSRTIEVGELKNLHVAKRPPHDYTSPDLVRFSLDWNGEGENAVSRVFSQISADSPLVLASMRNLTGSDDSARIYLESLGYAAYQLLPRYDLLVPILEGDELEPSCLNLFFCRIERAERLEAAGLLCREAEDFTNVAIGDESLWERDLMSQPYAAPRLKSWASGSPVGQYGEMYRFLLNLDMQARNFALPPGWRYASIKAIEAIIQAIMQAEPTASRLLTGIRLMAGLGKRAAAVSWARQLADGVAVGGKILDEPFISPIAQWDHIPIAADESLWARTAAQVASEKLRSFSSWYTADTSLDFWKSLRTNPLVADHAAYMVDLIKKRIMQGVRLGVFMDEDYRPAS